MSEATGSSTPDRRLLLGLSGTKLLIHVLLADRYGYFRDELYFLDCGRHLDWGYVDHAPLIGLVSRLALILGGSLHALRIFPAIAGAALVALTMLIAWRLGAGRFGQGLAGLAVLVAPIYLGTDSILSMNAFEPLFWMGSVYLLIRIVQTGNSRLWMGVGALAGLGLMNKHSTVFFLAALAAGVLLTPLRRELRGPWPWAGVAIALVIVSPNVAWQIAHGFPTLEDLQNVSREGKNVVLGPVAFFGQQIILLHPVLFPLWLAGLAWLFGGSGGRYRAFGWTYVALSVTLFALKGKNYYLAPIYPVLFAAGGTWLDAGLSRWRVTAGRMWPRGAIVALVLAAGAATAPLSLPILSPERYVAYEKALGSAPPKTEVAHRGPLPQLFGDQFGWEELVAEVARIYDSLPEEERARTAIYANNYGEAGAINLFGPRLGLPPAISGHQTHFFWGPRGYTGEIVIVLQGDRDELQEQFESVETAGEHHHPWGMEEENNEIYLCRGLKTPLAVLWPSVKHWN
ncbi:MAG TPA: glycosyltransferase family 39 protein [Candidatus Polarisedimenticolia bacterium]|nr:glycosyltransferase family 39 protein [Candidatus Polarisedimenticolia bacterium]